MWLQLGHVFGRPSSAARSPLFESASLPRALPDFLGAIIAHRGITIKRLPAPFALSCGAPRDLPPPLPGHPFHFNRGPIRILQAPRPARLCLHASIPCLPFPLCGLLDCLLPVPRDSSSCFSLFSSHFHFPISAYRYSSSTIRIAPFSSNTTSKDLPFFT